MKITKTHKALAGCVSLLLTATVAPAAVTSVTVDMDTVTPGIQSTINVLPGASFSVDLWATVDAGGVSSFSISSRFDTSELQLDPPLGPAWSQPALPGGLIGLGVLFESNALGQEYSFGGLTFGVGPASTSFIFGSIAFTAPTPVTDGFDDVNVGYFNLPGALDDSFDNLGASALSTTIFTGGQVNLIPEPTSSAILALSAMGLLARRRRHA